MDGINMDLSAQDAIWVFENVDSWRDFVNILRLRHMEFCANLETLSAVVWT